MTTVTLTAEDGTTNDVQATVTPYSTAGRTARATGFVLIGLGGAAACIIIPVLHLITTWALPLVGILLAVRAYRSQFLVSDVNGTCPACKEAVSLAGGRVAEEPIEVQCPECHASLRLAVTPLAGVGGDTA